MNNYFLVLAAALVFASCSKNDSTTTTPNPVTNSVSGKFSIAYDSTKFIIDSIRGYYLNPMGNLDSTTLRRAYSWESPTRRYDKADSGYARVFAWGQIRVIGAEAPALKFSETFNMEHSSSNKKDSTLDFKVGFSSSYGFRY